jgi:hypothetical protein
MDHANRIARRNLFNLASWPDPVLVNETSVAACPACAILQWLATSNDEPRPFVCKATVEVILKILTKC